MSISEQVKELRNLVKEYNNPPYGREVAGTAEALSQAADTIEALSAKLAAANMERNEILKEIREKAQELSNQHWGDDERHLIGKGIQCMCVQAENIIKENMERSAEDCGGWIPCNVENLPDKEVLCCDNQGEMILGYVLEDETSDTGFSAESDHEYMYGCVKWMEKPKT